MNIYLAGPMTGYEFFNFNNFDRRRNRLVDDGYSVFSPADHDRFLLGKDPDWYPAAEDTKGPWKEWDLKGTKTPTLRQMLGDDLQYIAKEADALYMLRGWERSNGCRAEHALATALGLEIWYE